MMKKISDTIKGIQRLTHKEIDEILKFNDEFTKIKLSSKDLEKHISATLRESKGPRGISKNKLIYLPEDNIKTMFLDLNKKAEPENIFNKYIENDVKDYESQIKIIEHNHSNKNTTIISPICKGYRIDLFEENNKNIRINNFKKYNLNITNENNSIRNPHPRYIELFAKINKKVRWNYIQFENKKAEESFKIYLRTINEI